MGETLGRYRSYLKLTFIEDEWARRSFMARGSVSQYWRIPPTAVRVTVQTGRAFLDVEGLRTRWALQAVLGPVLKMFDVVGLERHHILRTAPELVEVAEWHGLTVF